VICIVTAAAIAFGLKVLLATTTSGTNDVMTWEQDLIKANTQGVAALYSDGVQSRSPAGIPYEKQPFIHPPFMIHALHFWEFLAGRAHLPMRFWMRLTCAFVDIGSLVIMFQIGKQSLMRTFSPIALVLFAISPISILISGFHGNTDPIMMFFVLFSIYAIQRRMPTLFSGALMGLSLSIKVVPAIFVPAALLYISGIRHKINFGVAFISFFILSGLPYIALDPFLIMRTLSSYKSYSGLWGWSRLTSLAGRQDSLDHAKPILIILILLFSFAMNRFRSRLPLFVQCGLLTCVFMFFTPGFGVQYLSWLVPWVVCLGPTATAAYYLSGGIFISVVYTYWSRGFPWNCANSLAVPGWSPLGILFGLICWSVTGWLLFSFVVKWSKLCEDPSYYPHSQLPGFKGESVLK
jgi:hypothetical protein